MAGVEKLFTFVPPKKIHILRLLIQKYLFNENNNPYYYGRIANYDR